MHRANHRTGAPGYRGAVRRDIGLNVLYRQCLDRRISTIQQLGKEVKAWLTERDQNPPIVNWRFNTKDARIKMKRLYPALLPR